MLLVGGEPEQLAHDRQIDQERMPDRIWFTSVTVRPPITAVSPSATSSWFSAFCFLMVKPRSAAARVRMSDRSATTFISTWRLLVTCGVTFSLIPVSLKLTVALGGPGRAAGARAHIDHADRNVLTDVDEGFAVVQRGDEWLRLHIGHFHPLQRLHEGRRDRTRRWQSARPLRGPGSR